jgi:uncharacterized protein YrrD
MRTEASSKNIGNVIELQETGGFTVSDSTGRRVGQVEGPLYGTSPDAPDALAIRSGGLLRRHFLVPSTAIRKVDELTGAIELVLERGKLRRFL